MDAVVKAEGIVYSYGRRRVLDGASWQIGPGVNALLGPNGAGKTTLIRCLIGELRPHSGTVRINGEPVNAPSVRRRVGYVPQRPTLPALARVEDIIGYAAWLSGTSSADVGPAVDRVVEHLDLVELRRRRVRTLSGGQRQRVALATGIVHDPHVVFLDEPTVGLDPGQRLRVREVIQLIGRQRPVVLATHLTEDVQHLAATVTVLVSGQVQHSGPLDELMLSRARQGDSRPGSEFERAYDDMVAQLGARE